MRVPKNEVEALGVGKRAEMADRREEGKVRERKTDQRRRKQAHWLLNNRGWHALSWASCGHFPN